MVSRVSLACILLVTVLVFAGTAEVLYTLASPNEQEWGNFGVSVSGVGDVNGDGYDDMVVGAYGESLGTGHAWAGRAYVFDGQSGTLSSTLVSPNEEAAGYFGQAVSGAGDVNGDGYDDVLVGAYGENPGSSPWNAGRAYVFNGQTGGVIHALVSPNEETSGYFGKSVSGAGDVNGDGYEDIIVGAYDEDPGSSPIGAGRAYVFDGLTGSPIYTLVSPNEEEGGRFGWTVSGAGDVNADAYDDLLVGAHEEDPAMSPLNAGRAYVFSGQTGSLMHTLVSPNEQEYGYFGVSVSGAGDVNGDGYGDIVVGAYMEEASPNRRPAGRAYIFDGRTGNPLHTLVSDPQQAWAYFGLVVSGAGDINGDGYGDVLVGAYGENPAPSPTAAGRAHIFNGWTGSELHTLASPGEELQGYFGASVSGAGDVNGDGYDDVLVGAYQEDPGASPHDAGRAYVFSWLQLSSSLSGNALELQWSTWSPALEYWIYGADNLPYFDPGFAPGYEHKLDEVVPPTTTWSSSAGLGDPNNNWTYLVIAVDENEAELARSNYCGEQDFAMEIP